MYSITAYNRTNDIHSNIELKPHTGLEAETGKQVARLARRLWAGAALPPLLSSFSEVALEAAMKEAPELPRALLIAKEVPADWPDRVKRRSEEHTSELQSLMRISYAVFCLKKKKQNHID